MLSSPIDLTPLKDTGYVHLPHDPEYAQACLAWNRAVAQQPAAVATPRTIAEVARAVSEAVASGLRIAPQSTGHAAAALRPDALDRALLLRLDRLTGVTVDPEARTARIVGGTLWRDVLAVTAPHGLTALHGSAGDVSAVGYLLGGGLSFYSRTHGLATSTVRALEIVTPNGAVRRATAHDDPDLFWALRGGGGSFGVVVAVEIDLLPLATVTAGMLLWDLERAPDVLAGWADWTVTAPESATTSLRFMRFPPLPELPDFLRGRAVVVIDGAVLGSDAVAAQVLAPLRELGPELDTFGAIAATDLIGVHMDPPAPTPTVSDHALLAGLPAAAMEALLRVAGPESDTAAFIVELRHLGGALRRPIDAALAAVDGEYLLFATTLAPTAEAAEAGLLGTSAVIAALGDWAAGTTVANFDERPGDGSSGFAPGTLARLAQVRAQVDPQRVMTAAHPVG